MFASALEQYIPAGLCTYTLPTGGMFFWLSFPTLAHLSTQHVFEAFAAADVIVAPGPTFYVPGIFEQLEAGATPNEPCAGVSGSAVDDAVGDAVGDEKVRAALRVPPVKFPCVRACYAAVGADKIVEAVRAMAQVVVSLHDNVAGPK